VTHYRPAILILWLLLTAAACSTLPDVRSFIGDPTLSTMPLTILGPDGTLSRDEIDSVLKRLRLETNPKDIIDGNLTTMAAAGARPLVVGNRASLLVDGDETFDAMLDSIAQAKDHVNFETYIIEDDDVGRRFSDLLLKKRAEGIEVNLIYDSFGCRGTPRSFFDRLKNGGVNVVEYNPATWILSFRNGDTLFRRTHRKMLVVDGVKAFVGGINIGNAYMRGRRHRKGQPSVPTEYWRDTHVVIEGPAASEFQRLFMDTWTDQHGPLLSKGNYFRNAEGRGDQMVQAVSSQPGYMNRTTYIMYVSAIAHARHSIHLTHSYFAPDTQLLQALKDAASRGVDVRIILPKYTDHFSVREAARWHYSDLLKSGVRIFERRETVLHAKTAVIDGVWSTVGSTNLELWSFVTIDEVNAVILGRQFADEMESLFEDDLDESEEILWENWRQRPLLDRTKQLFFSLFDYWM
jgi:cardiolipin synthase A/B